MPEFIWGYKTVAIFDVWTIEHILTGISVGTGVIIHNNKSLGELFSRLAENIIHPQRINFLKYKYDIYLLLFIAYLWETLEHYLETGLAGGAVEYWFQGVEYWPNRLIADPLMLILGYWLAKKLPNIVWPARIISLAWLALHIFVFPHSMYLHEIF